VALHQAPELTRRNPGEQGRDPRLDQAGACPSTEGALSWAGEFDQSHRLQP